jgi:peroxiredoxin
MKKFYLTLLLLPLLFINARSANGGHLIKIHIKGLKDSTCYIGFHYGKNQYIKQDTAKADANGNLIFKGKEPLPGGVYILSMPRNYMEFLIGEQNFSLETDTSNLILNMKVKNSPENEIFYDYQKMTYRMGNKVDSIRRLMKATKDEEKLKAHKKELTDVNKEVSTFRKSWMDAHPKSFAVKLIKAATEPDVPEAPKLSNGRTDSTFGYRWFKAHYFDNMDLTDERLVRTPFFHNKLDYFFKNLVPQLPDSINYDADRVISLMEGNKEAYKYTVWFVLNTYENSQIMGMDAVLVHIGKKYYLSGKAPWADSNTVQQIRRRVHTLDPILIGKTAPDLYLTDSLGKVIKLYNVKSKYTVLVFWDSDCGHCQKEIPILHDYYTKHKKDRQIEVYAATTERKQKQWKKFIRDHKLGDWINVWDSFTVTDFNKAYDVYSTPVMYVLDANKKIIAKRIMSEQLDELFDKLDKIEAYEKEEKYQKMKKDK